MPKKIIQDVIPPENKKSIRNISIPNRKPKISEKNVVTPNTNTVSNTVNRKSTNEVSPNLEKNSEKTIPGKIEINQIPTIKEIPHLTKKNNRNFYYYSFLTIFFASIAYLIFMFLNVGAYVDIEPKIRSVSLAKEFSAKSNAQLGELAFEVLEITEELSKTAPSNGEKKVEKKATGTVILYNDYSTANQRIIKNTRLETADGKIYRIDNSVVIPGQKVLDGKKVPGSIEVTATADASGEKYNIDLVDFTIPGFKDEPDKYDKFYARSKTPMSGGYSGTIKTASEADREIALKEVTASLKSSLLNKSRDQTPPSLILFENAIFYSTQVLSPPESNEVRVKMTMHGIMFDRESLAKFIAKETLPQYDESERVTLKDVSNLNFKPNSLEVTPWLTGVMPFELSGNANIEWIVDETALINDLVGLPKSSSNNVFATYKGIEKATVTIKPAWKSTFPEDKTKIKINFAQKIDLQGDPKSNP